MRSSWTSVAIAWIGFQLLVTAVLAWHLGVYTSPPWESYRDVSIAVSAIGTILFAFWQLRTFPPSPFAAVRGADWAPVGRLYAACLCLYGQFIALTWMKCLMPVATQFWGDAVLFNFERALFGTDAWRIFPTGNAAFAQAYIYWPAVVTAVFAYNAMRARGAACLAFFLTVGGLGVFAQYLLPSAGPIFWHQVLGIDAFQAPVPESMTAARDYLWDGYAQGLFLPAGGISAFPSVHTGCAMWVALATRHWAGWIFWALVYFASIAYGWHYFSGVTFASVAAVGFWFAAKAILKGRTPVVAPEPVACPA